jgi:hypothetical protein
VDSGVGAVAVISLYGVLTLGDDEGFVPESQKASVVEDEQGYSVHAPAPSVIFDGCIVIFPPAERPDSIWLDLAAIASFTFEPFMFEPNARARGQFDRYVLLSLGNGGVLSLPLSENQQEAFTRAWKGCGK